MRQDPVHQGVPEELLAGPALHLLDLEHRHPQVRGGQDDIEIEIYCLSMCRNFNCMNYIPSVPGVCAHHYGEVRAKVTISVSR